jgi:hypothetical protein
MGGEGLGRHGCDGNVAHCQRLQRQRRDRRQHDHADLDQHPGPHDGRLDCGSAEPDFDALVGKWLHDYLDSGGQEFR